MELYVRKFHRIPPSKWFIGQGWQNFGLHYYHELFVQLRAAGFVVRQNGTKGFTVTYNHAPDVGRVFAVMHFEGRLRELLKVEKLQNDRRIRDHIYLRDPHSQEIWVQRALDTPNASGYFFNAILIILVVIVIMFHQCRVAFNLG